jgi:hypothetical protein
MAPHVWQRGGDHGIVEDIFLGDKYLVVVVVILGLVERCIMNLLMCSSRSHFRSYEI